MKKKAFQKSPNMQALTQMARSPNTVSHTYICTDYMQNRYINTLKIKRSLLATNPIFRPLPRPGVWIWAVQGVSTCIFCRRNATGVCGGCQGSPGSAGASTGRRRRTQSSSHRHHLGTHSCMTLASPPHHLSVQHAFLWLEGSIF